MLVRDPDCLTLGEDFHNDEGYCYCYFSEEASEYQCIWNKYEWLNNKCVETRNKFELAHGRCMPDGEGRPTWWVYSPDMATQKQMELDAQTQGPIDYSDMF